MNQAVLSSRPVTIDFNKCYLLRAIMGCYCMLVRAYGVNEQTLCDELGSERTMEH